MDKINQLRKKLIESAKKKVQERYEEKEVHITKAVKILEDLDTTSNLLIEQLREWHSVHFPELNDMLKENEEYLKLVYTLGNRKNFTPDKVFEAIDDKGMAEEVSGAAEKSMGSEASEKDMQEIRALALNCYNLRNEREAIAKYIESEMKKELPVFTELCGATLGAKMLAKALTKKKLAFMPASRLQVIGAEKALFMHFKMGVKGPKYGYLYQHPLVQSAKIFNKGKVARAVAAKLSIAARMDYFGSKGSAQKMKKELEQKAKEINDAVPSAKPKKEQKIESEKPGKQEKEESQEPETEPQEMEAPTERKEFNYESRPRPRRDDFSGPRKFAPERSHGGFHKEKFQKHGKRNNFSQRRGEKPGFGREGGWRGERPQWKPREGERQGFGGRGFENMGQEGRRPFGDSRFSKPRFKREGSSGSGPGFRKPGFRREGHGDREGSGFRKPGFRREGFSNDGFKRDKFGNSGFRKPGQGGNFGKPRFGRPKFGGNRFGRQRPAGNFKKKFDG